MPWFRLEDNFHHHPKVRKAGNAATGLWVRCGTYSAQYLTDGRVPVEIAHDYGRQREIDALLATRLWIEKEDGFMMPDYLDYNPSAEQVLADRARARDRQAKRRRDQQGRYE